MKILVTGGTGFTGKALVKRLLKERHQVIALDYKEGFKTEELRDLGAEVVIGSVTDKMVVNRSMKDVEVVHHLAAAFREMNVPERYYLEVNVQGTRNVLEAAYEHKIGKFIYCSTCGVHGNVLNPPTGEEDNISPADYYQQTKYDAEPIVDEYFRKGMKTVILRPAAIYGPGDPERFFLLYKRVSKGTFPMFGKGKTLYHPLYIDNFIDALLLSMKDGRGDGEVLLIADEEYVSIEYLVRKVAESLNIYNLKISHYPITPLVIAGHVFEKICKPFHIIPPIFPRRVDWYRQNRAFNIEKAKRELGYDPKIGLEEGLRKTAEWYKKEGFL
jgi:nucleoside-diphosphate-sugar epimerase